MLADTSILVVCLVAYKVISSVAKFVNNHPVFGILLLYGNHFFFVHMVWALIFLSLSKLGVCCRLCDGVVLEPPLVLVSIFGGMGIR